MRFALLGDHPDGLDMARALNETGRHELAVYSGPSAGEETLRRWGLKVARVGDLEEVLADPALDLVLVASSHALRPGQLRRALQSERHVFCLHPADLTPDLGYEAALMAQDTRKILLPLMPEALHPAFRRLAELVRGQHLPALSAAAHERVEQASGRPHSVNSGPRTLVRAPRTGPSCQLGMPQLLTFQRCLPGPLTEEVTDRPAGLPGWDVLRLVGGDVAEVMALSATEELERDRPLLLTGRFLSGLLFQGSLLPGRREPSLTFHVQGSQGEVRLEFPGGWPGEARLTYRDLEGSEQSEDWPPLNPWPALVEVLERTLARKDRNLSGAREEKGLTWQNAIRALELDDAARRSVARRRASTLDYQEVTEEATFKGAMTLMGCGLLWTSLLLLILSILVPWLGWLILPVFGIFLIMQALGWVVPHKAGVPSETNATAEGKTPEGPSL